MDEALRAAGAARPVDVVVELGAGEGARTGARTEADCAAVADAVAAASTLRLVGVAGYEGEVPDGRPGTGREWLRRLVALAADFDAAGRFAGLGGDPGQRGRQRVVRRGRRRLRGDPRALPARAQAAALRGVRQSRRRPLPAAHPLQPGPREGHSGTRLPALGAGRLAAHLRSRRSSTPASVTRPTTLICLRRRSSGPPPPAR